MWRIGLKWWAGILLVVVACMTVTTWAFVRMTEEGPAVEAMSIALALSLSPGGLDDPTDINAFRSMLAAAPGDVIKPIPGLNITVAMADLDRFSPRELKLMLFRQIALPVYREGDAGLASLAESEEMRQAVSGGVGLLAVLSAATHREALRVLSYLLCICLALAGALAAASRGFGRLLSPGIAVALAALPGVRLVPLALGRLAASTPLHPTQGGSMADMVTLILQGAAPPLLGAALAAYRAALLAGVVLAGAGLTGAAVIAVRRRRLELPRWQWDARFAAGVLLFLCLQAALGTYTLSRLSEREPSVRLVSGVLVEYMGEAGAKTAPATAQRFYDTGPSALADLGQSPQVQQMIDQYAGHAAAVFSRAAHDRLAGRLWRSVLAAALLMGVVVALSPGWRRLSAPGWFLVLPVAPWAGALAPLLGQATGSDGLSGVVLSALGPALGAVARTAYGLLLAGAALLAVSLGGRVISWILGRSRRRHERAAT